MSNYKIGNECKNHSFPFLFKTNNKMNNKTNNKMEKDYIGYSFWKNLRNCNIQIDINPIVETVIEKYEENKIPYLKSEIEDKVWSKIHKNRYDVMEYLF